MIKVFTMNSVYEIDRSASTWRKLRKRTNVTSEHPLRTDSGTFWSLSDIELGSPMVIKGASLTEGMAMRVITTSPVVAFREEL